MTEQRTLLTARMGMTTTNPAEHLCVQRLETVGRPAKQAVIGWPDRGTGHKHFRDLTLNTQEAASWKNPSGGKRPFVQDGLLTMRPVRAQPIRII